MVKALEHPQLGRLIPDQFGEDLLFFRQFSEFKIFWQPDSAKQLEDLEPEHLSLVKQWKQQPVELVEICRNFDVLAALQSLGVYEVGIGLDVAVQQTTPSAAQVDAWKFFEANEKAFCTNACEALTRYYRYLRDVEPKLFEDEADCPEAIESSHDLINCIRFDGMNLSQTTAQGRSTISFGWEVDWDMEHGLQMIFFEDQVIGMGNDLYGPEDLSTPANFLRESFSAAELTAFEKFQKEFIR